MHKTYQEYKVDEGKKDPVGGFMQQYAPYLENNVGVSLYKM